jgi:acetyltransferase-like isoleucine patch superfamily enzyme
LNRLTRRVYELAYGRHLPPGDSGQEPEMSTVELVAYLWQKGGAARLRGLWRSWRLGGCAGRLFVGRGVRISFPRHLRVGYNCLLSDGVHVNAYSREGFRLGDNVRVREHVWMLGTAVLTDPGVGLSLGDNVYVGPYCVLGAGGGLTIGSDVTIGAHVDILAENHSFEDPDVPINRQGVEREGIVIEDDCWIGNRATILDGVRVGRGSVIGAAAVVTRNIPEFSVAVGSPARVVRDRRYRGPVVEAAPGGSDRSDRSDPSDRSDRSDRPVPGGPEPAADPTRPT